MTLHVVFSVLHIQIGTCMEKAESNPNDRPYSRYLQSLHAPKDGWDKSDVTCFLMGKQVIKVVYHLQKVSGKSGWKGNGARLFGSLQRKTSESNGTSEKVSPVFPNGMF